MDERLIGKTTLHYLAGWGHIVFEGSAGEEELSYLSNLVRRISPARILEIGFNAGLSSQAMLAATPEVRVVSFDLGDHPYIERAKRYVDLRSPGRHELILGDSRSTVPRYPRPDPGEGFDFAFIDGGHEVDVVRADIRNARAVCKPGAHVLIDDLTPWRPWGVGPTMAWAEAIGEGMVVQEEVFADGRLVDSPREPADRAWALGRFK